MWVTLCIILFTEFFLWSDAGRPILQPFSFRSGVYKGQSVSVMCAVAEGSGPLTFTWTKDGSSLTDSQQVKIRTTDDEYSILHISSTDSNQAGNYTCTVSNDLGTGNFTAELQVFESPEWIEIPEDTEVILGSSGTLNCMASGIPDPKVTWSKTDGETSSGLRSNGRHSISNNGSLLLMNVQVTDAGSYECYVANGVGNGLRKVVNIYVRVPPQFRESYSLMKIRSGYSASLKCEAYGDTPMFIQWSKDYPHFKDPRHRVTETPLPSGLLSEVQVSQVTRQDTGLYVCFARNAYGQQERTIKLVVLEPPASPAEIFVKEIGSYEVTVHWAEPYNGNSPVLRYIIQYWKDSGVTPKLEEGTVRGEQTSYEIKVLLPGASYVVRVIAENQFGASTPSTPVKFTTNEDKPSGYPTDISIFSRASSAINISWKAPPPDQRNGAIQGYEVGYRNRQVSEHFTFMEVPLLPGEVQEYTLMDLKENTEYEVIVRAFNRAGRGPSSVAIIARTREAVKLTTPVLWTESTTSSSILLYWSGNDALSSDAINYTIHYQAEGGPWLMKKVPGSNTKSYLLSQLNADTLYHIYVEASSGNEKRSVSATLSTRTSAVDASNLMSSSSMTHAAEVTHQTALVISLSVVISSVIIVCIIAGACVYVTRVKLNRDDKLDERADLTEHQSRSMSASSPSNFHYVDVNSRPLLWCSTPAPPNDYPSPYATLPLRSTTITKRWNSDEGLSPAESMKSDSLHSQRVEIVEEKSDKISTCHD